MPGFKNVWRGVMALWIGGTVFSACGGQSSSDSGGRGGAPSGGAPGGVAGTAGFGSGAGGAGGSASGSTGGGAGGSASTTGGASTGTAAAGAGTALGCDFNGVHHASGTEWPFGCNTCACDGSQVNCTLRVCPGSGGSSGIAEGGSAGVAQSGSAGVAFGGASGGRSDQCTIAQTGTLCVTPANGGQVLEVGAPLALTMRAAGCYSSSCTRVVSSGCNYIGSERKFAISTFMCLANDGDDGCTADCGGAPTLPCDPHITLEAGDYSITLAPNSEPKLQFQVPSKLLSPLCIALE